MKNYILFSWNCLKRRSKNPFYFVLLAVVIFASCKPIIIPTRSIIQNTAPAPSSFISVPMEADYSAFLPEIRDQFPWTVGADRYADNLGTPGPDNGRDIMLDTHLIEAILISEHLQVIKS